MIQRRNLPHISKDDYAHFVTFCTHARWQMPPWARHIALDAVLHGHTKKHFLSVCVVMPDHVHLVINPLVDHKRSCYWSVGELTQVIKGYSAYVINRELGSKGKLWQTESFDHVLRRSDSLIQKVDYILQNPVRKGLVARSSEYPWLWRNPSI